jgi:hypothetical protein
MDEVQKNTSINAKEKHKFKIGGWGGGRCNYAIQIFQKKMSVIITLSVFLSLAPQPSLGLDLLHKIQLNFLGASQQFSFLQVRVVSPTPNLHPGGPGLCIYIPQRQSGYPF